MDTSIPIGIERESADTDRYLLQISQGAADLQTTTTESRVRLTRRQAAVWYAGGDRSTAAARLAGIHATDEQSLTVLIRSTTDHEPWLAEHF